MAAHPGGTRNPNVPKDGTTPILNNEKESLRPPGVPRWVPATTLLSMLLNKTSHIAVIHAKTVKTPDSCPIHIEFNSVRCA
jgi:hypothetical protein